MFNPIDSAINSIVKGTDRLSQVEFDCPHERVIAHLGWQWQSSINYQRLLPQQGQDKFTGESLLMTYGLGEMNCYLKGTGSAHDVAVMLSHDAIHALFNLGATYADEAMVVNLLGQMKDGSLTVISKAFTEKLIQLNIESGDA